MKENRNDNSDEEDKTRLEKSKMSRKTNKRYRENKIMNYNEVLERNVSEVESTDKVT